jgi:ribonuclease P protein component
VLDALSAQNPMERLKQRADFLAAAAGAKASGTSAPAAGFVLQARDRGDAAPSRVGFTVSRKVGNAVERNRVRRRLRDIVRRSAALPSASGHDYVLIGRRAALELPFDRMMAEFAGALKRVHGKPRVRAGAEKAI